MNIRAIAIALWVVLAVAIPPKVTLAKSDHATLKPRAPDSARSVMNPVSYSQDSVELGYELWQDADCSGCHGPGNGQGEGGMDPRPTDFTNSAWQDTRTDGEIYYTITKGSDGTAMIPQDVMFDDPADAWHVVNFIRGLLDPQMDEIVPKPRKPLRFPLRAEDYKDVTDPQTGKASEVIRLLDEMDGGPGWFGYDSLWEGNGSPDCDAQAKSQLSSSRPTCQK
ncbi:MAG: c-type cytochrome [Leptospirillia bacterium]